MKGEKLKSLVTRMFDVVRDRCTPDEIVCLCMVPGCKDTSGNRSFNLKTGKTNCWRCNKGGDAVNLLRWCGYAIDDSSSSISTTDEFYSLLNKDSFNKTLVPVISEIDMPKGFTPCASDLNSEYTKQIGIMARRKNLDLSDFIAVGAGFTREMSSKWTNFCIFPVVEYGRVVYFQGRTYWDTPGESTKRFPDRKEAPLSSKYWVYNIDELREKKAPKVIVVESILNVLSLKKKFSELGITDIVPVCVFKHSVSKAQLYKILRCACVKEMIMLFDLDAVDLSWEFAPKACNMVKVSVAKMPDSANKKLDPNDDVCAAISAIRDRTVFSSVESLKAAIQSATSNRIDLTSIIIDK